MELVLVFDIDEVDALRDPLEAVGRRYDEGGSIEVELNAFRKERSVMLSSAPLVGPLKCAKRLNG